MNKIIKILSSLFTIAHTCQNIIFDKRCFFGLYIFNDYFNINFENFNLKRNKIHKEVYLMKDHYITVVIVVMWSIVPIVLLNIVPEEKENRRFSIILI